MISLKHNNFTKASVLSDDTEMSFRLFSRSEREITTDCNVYCYALSFIFVYFRVVKEKSLLIVMFLSNKPQVSTVYKLINNAGSW